MEEACRIRIAMQWLTMAVALGPDLSFKGDMKLKYMLTTMKLLFISQNSNKYPVQNNIISD